MKVFYVSNTYISIKYLSLRHPNKVGSTDIIAPTLDKRLLRTNRGGISDPYYPHFTLVAE